MIEVKNEIGEQPTSDVILDKLALYKAINISIVMPPTPSIQIQIKKILMQELFKEGNNLNMDEDFYMTNANKDKDKKDHHTNHGSKHFKDCNNDISNVSIMGMPSYS